MSEHSVFVLDKEGNPLTPCKPQRARKLMEDGQAKPVWNKFNKFGIQMLVETRKETPDTCLGCDQGTKFEGYSVVTPEENNCNIMWKLPDKKQIVRKMKERRQARRARRSRLRRREERFDNRNREGFIAPSQEVIVDSRLKCMSELFKTYPINLVANEDVRFNHAKHRWGANFSTVEVGKNKIRQFFAGNNAELFEYRGFGTAELRKSYSLHKVSNKSKEAFSSHCVDSYVLACETLVGDTISTEKEVVVVDDTYRPVRRKLFDSQPSEGGVYHKYSSGNFNGVRKGTLCRLGIVVGGTRNSYYIRNWDNKRISKSVNKIDWLSHHFKTKVVNPKTIKRERRESIKQHRVEKQKPIQLTLF